MDNARADAASFNELLDAGFANAYQGKLGRSKERVGCDQEQDQEHPDQHESDHEWPNSNILKVVFHSQENADVVTWL